MIDEGHRAFACGMTGSGKSKLLSYYFAQYPGQRLLVDVNDDYELGPTSKEEGASLAREPGAIDWTKRTIRYVPSRLDQDEYEELYTAIWARVHDGRHPLLVWLDECEGPTTSNSSPLHLRLALGQGRKKKLTHLAASLRPVEIYGKIVSQSEHAFVFKTAEVKDIEPLARRMKIKQGELEVALEQLPEYGFLYHRVGAPQILSFPALDGDRVKLAGRHIRTP